MTTLRFGDSVVREGGTPPSPVGTSVPFTTSFLWTGPEGRKEIHMTILRYLLRCKILMVRRKEFTRPPFL